MHDLVSVCWVYSFFASGLSTANQRNGMAFGLHRLSKLECHISSIHKNNTLSY